MKHLDRLEEYIMLVTFPLMLFIVLTVTLTRFFNLFSIPWGEEAARYLMIWLGFAGISYGFKKNAHLGLSFVVDRLPPVANRFCVLLRTGLIIFFGVLVAWFSFKILQKQFQFSQISPSLHLPMWTVYLAVFVGGLLTIVRAIQALLMGSGDGEGVIRTEGQ